MSIFSIPFAPICILFLLNWFWIWFNVFEVNLITWIQFNSKWIQFKLHAMSFNIFIQMDLIFTQSINFFHQLIIILSCPSLIKTSINVVWNFDMLDVLMWICGRYAISPNGITFKALKDTTFQKNILKALRGMPFKKSIVKKILLVPMWTQCLS